MYDSYGFDKCDTIKKLGDILKKIINKIQRGEEIYQLHSREVRQEGQLPITRRKALMCALRLRKPNTPPVPKASGLEGIAAIYEWCRDNEKPGLTEGLTPTQKKLHRQADMAVILKKEPDIKIEVLAKIFDVHPSTISRDGVWKIHQKLPIKSDVFNKL